MPTPEISDTLTDEDRVNYQHVSFFDYSTIAYKNDFKFVVAALRSENRDYKLSGFDRGHMAAAGNHRSSQADCNQTFLLSNMAPQVQYTSKGCTLIVQYTTKGCTLIVQYTTKGCTLIVQWCSG